MAKENPIFDVVVVGAGPAGATVALKLARQQHRVVLIDRAKYPRKVPCAGWVSAKVQPLLGELGLAGDEARLRPFTQVAFYNSDLSKKALPKFASPPGFLVDRAAFDHWLVEAAVAAGVTFVEGQAVAAVSLRENTVRAISEKGKEIRGELLVLAAGRGTPLLDGLGLGVLSQPVGYWVAQVETAKAGRGGPPTVAVILGLTRTGGFGMVVASERSATVGVHLPGDRQEVIPQLVALCKRVVGAGVLEVDLTRQAASAPVLAAPLAVGLAMDTHVAKRALIVGDAGGFVSALSGEGIYPAMWSASLAADVLHRALRSSSPQDVLIEFDRDWRTTMADYLRFPNTDAQYLLPLIFSNQPIADRMGAAFFSGENI